VTSFLGGQALTNHDPAGWTWIALAAFAGLLGVAVLVLREPKPITAARPTELISRFIEVAQPSPEELAQKDPATAGLTPLALLYRDLSLYMEESHQANKDQVEGLSKRFDQAAALLMVEILAWVIQLA
jgi:hypothetical protein